MLFSTPVMAVEPIVGAFGFKLGDVWDGEAVSTHEMDGYLLHDFIPDSPLDAFSTYWVDVTLVKGLIFRIEAFKRGSCDSQFLALKNVLSKKYGSGKKLSIGSTANTYDMGRYWSSGMGKEFRTIELQCVNRDLRLKYTDLYLEENRTDELEAQAESADL